MTVAKSSKGMTFEECRQMAAGMIRQGDHHALAVLLAKHGSPLLAPMSDGQTLLHIAVYNENLEAVKILMSYGPQNVLNSALKTPIGLAAAMGWAEGYLAMTVEFEQERLAQIKQIFAQGGFGNNGDIQWDAISKAMDNLNWSTKVSKRFLELIYEHDAPLAHSIARLVNPLMDEMVFKDPVMDAAVQSYLQYKNFSAEAKSRVVELCLNPGRILNPRIDILIKFGFSIHDIAKGIRTSEVLAGLRDDPNLLPIVHALEHKLDGSLNYFMFASRMDAQELMDGMHYAGIQFEIKSSDFTSRGPYARPDIYFNLGLRSDIDLSSVFEKYHPKISMRINELALLISPAPFVAPVLKAMIDYAGKDSVAGLLEEAVHEVAKGKLSSRALSNLMDIGIVPEPTKGNPEKLFASLGECARRTRQPLVDFYLTALKVYGHDGIVYAGNTLLHLAAKNGEAEAVKELLATGSDPYVKNMAGRTPFQVGYEHPDVGEVLATEMMRTKCKETQLDQSTTRKPRV